MARLERRGRATSLTTQVLLRAVPAAILALTLIWASAVVQTRATVRHEALEKVRANAAAAANAVAAQLNGFIAYARTVASNDFLMTGLLDLERRDLYLPSFFRTLRVPQASDGIMSLAEYTGRIIVSTGPAQAGRSLVIDNLDVNGELIRVTSEGLTVVTPVRYLGAVEGFVELHIPAAAVAKALADALGRYEAILHLPAVDETSPLPASGATSTSSGILRVSIPEFPGVSVDVASNEAEIAGSADRLNYFLLGAFGADLGVLIIAISLTARAVARPIAELARQLEGKALDQEIHAIPFSRPPPYEIQTLASALNAAARRAHAESKLRTAALEELGASAARNALLAAAIENTTAGILIVDAAQPDQPITYCNSAFTQITGYAFAEVVGRNCRFLVGPATDAETRSSIRKAVSQGKQHVCEVVNYRKNGETFLNFLSISPVHDQAGCLRYFVGALNDITELRESQMRMMQSAKLASLGQMASSVAHEINQPLTVVGMAAQNALTHLGSDPACVTLVAEKLERIIAQVQRAKLITDRMRAYAASPTSPPIQSFDAVETACITAESLRDVFRASGVSFDFSGLAFSHRFIRGNPLEFEQVVFNLLMNAKEAFAARGPGPDAKIRISTSGVEPASWQISIADNAGGIPDAILPHLFEPFVTTKKIGQGPGLGLYFCRNAIQRMGGSISADNRDGGAQVVLTFPCTEEMEGAGDAHQAALA
jgi:PAS domain S-box-containing protein